MPRIVVLYPPPVDAAAFEQLYLEEHVPLVRAQMPAVRRFEVSRVQGGARGPYYWMAQLHFDSMDALRSTASSDGAQRAAGHAQQISTGGVPTTLIVDDVHPPTAEVP
ncbi:MAG: EthD family reductase [Gemmatimonadaceae bacterium]